METVLMVTERRSGKKVLILGPDISLQEQVEKSHALFLKGSDEYSKAEVCYLTACKPALNISKPPKQSSPTKTTIPNSEK